RCTLFPWKLVNFKSIATMSYLKLKAQEDKDRETVSDSPGRTQEPLQSHTFSLKNNAAGLSSDEHENPLNGTQPNPFVYSSVPAVPHAGNLLPSGALVNGPGSHPTSEVHCVLNKGTVLSNNVLDAVWQAEKDTSPEVLRPPSELQSDAWKNTAGLAIKTLATQPGVNVPLSHSEENESKLAYSTLSGDSAEQMHLSQPLTKQTITTRYQQGVEWSESSLHDYCDAEVIRWDSGRECFLHTNRGLETVEVMHRKDGKHNTHVKNVSGSLEKVTGSLFHTNAIFCSGNVVEIIDIANKDDSLGTQSDLKYPVAPLKDLSRNTAVDSEHHIYSTAQEGCNEQNDPEDEDSFSTKVEQLKTEQVEQDPLFFSCTICNVNFKEKRHFHRHMMYHLDKHNQVNSENDSQPFICRECGRLFCDSNSLTRHIIIHQDRLEKLMEEIKGSKNTESEDSATTVRCPQCVIGCNCPKISVQHAKTHDNLKHYYFCEECNYITLTQQALETHLHVTHLNTYEPQYRKRTHTNDAEGADRVEFRCKRGFYTGRNKVVLKRRSEQPSRYCNYRTFSDKCKTPGQKPKSTFVKPVSLPFYSSKRGVTCIENSNGKSVNSPQFKCHVGCTKNTMLPSLWRIDKQKITGKLLLQPAEKLNVATDLTCVEEDGENNDCKAFGSSKQANCAANTDFLLSARNLKLDQMFCQDSRNDPASESLQVQALQHSPSMSKMSTPLHNTIDNMNGNILPKLSQRLKKHSAVREFEKGCGGSNNFSKDTSEATGSFLESSKNERNQYAWGYFRKRQRFLGEDQSPHVLKDEDDGDEDCSDIDQLIIKEEYIEATVCDDSPEFPCTSTSDSLDVFSTPVIEHKPCPYCPAVFESGVGLSNHVRGHLHRVGLSYNARHMVSPEQVALRDHQPRIRRRISTGTRKVRKVIKPENQREYTCPLCCGWFDTKTGLSNHVRGHLKRIGRSVTSTSKSPLCILNDLLQDKKGRQTILQTLKKSHFPLQPLVSPRLISSNGLFQIRTGIPAQFQYGLRNLYPISDSFVAKQEAEAVSERTKLQVQAQRRPKATSSTLVELLKMREESMELTARNNQPPYAIRNFCDMTKYYKEESEMESVEQNWSHGMTIFPCFNAEIYTLTCRFCDLVFQGPLSVQEDWIRHLQRHLLHTSVPHSGTGMVEVLGAFSLLTAIVY
uniref:C2H2-type domain-containing protein n=1 Tax=Anabas testudineus TaxID=64144 RepID=A0A3Q1I0C2_ANATE